MSITETKVPRNWGKIAIYVAGGFSAVVALMVAVGWNMDDSPRAKLERIRDECERSYGKASSQSFDCFARLTSRFAIEQQQNTLDRAYRNAQ